MAGRFLGKRAAAGAGLALLAMAALAQAGDDLYTEPRLDVRGDYTTNAGPVAGQARNPDRPGALWRVVADGLRCRQQAAPTGTIGRTFKRGTIIQANVGRGGSDEVLDNARDTRGRTWMWVRSQDGASLGCYVRANPRYIVPVRPGRARHARRW